MEDTRKLVDLGYSFGKLIGKGCYGRVFKAKYADQTSGEVVDLACKFIIRNKCPNNFLTKFLPRELDILKKISHPNIIKIHSIVQSNTSIFIFMRLAEHGDLLDYIKRNGVASEAVANVWFFQLTSAINYLHSINIAHRDLKCENILISCNLNLKIADFGFARFTLSVEDFFSTDTEIRELSETYCGSAAYAPPEVVSGTPYDIMKVDVWALGIILSIIINGRMPFDDSNIAKLIKDQKQRAYNTNSEVMKKISSECKFIIYKCLEPDPNLRWSSSELLKAPWLKYQVERQGNKK
ncbi:testis-specific serine/threonine-protein kinase 1-like [Chironomus tepperi]|uniref:testis-specific serine/threonine-protein kinase 1-like n=1 Tax=Chironomus tepperi TaxID=113505 RepID=UPI00391F62CF